MKSKLFKTFLTGVVASGLAIGTGVPLHAAPLQDQSKPSAGYAYAPPPETTSDQPVQGAYEAPQSNDQTAQAQYNDPGYSNTSPQYNNGPADAAPSASSDLAPADPGPAYDQGPQNGRQYSQLSTEQLNQLVAPIALYPDALVAQILAASQYPTQIVQANRFIKENPDLQGRALGDDVDKQDWDPSVKALCQFPRVLANLDRDLSWTQELGDANYNQADDVRAAIQRMRHKAKEAGNLRTNERVRVEDQDDQIQIQPSDPETVYVPEYNPQYVYGYPVGIWPGFYPWWGVGFGGPYISWGWGFPIAPFWGFGWGWGGWGIGWGFHGGIFFGGRPWGFRGPGFYNRAAFFHGNYRGYARGGFANRGFANRGFAGRGTTTGRGFSGAAGNRGTSRSFSGSAGNRSYSRGSSGYSGSRGYSGNRAYSGSSRSYSGGSRSYSGRGMSGSSSHSFTQGGSQRFSSRGSSGRGSSGFGGGHSGGGGHSFGGGHSSGGGSHGGGGGHRGR